MLDTRQIFAESLDPAYLPARCVALPGETDDVLVGALGLSSAHPRPMTVSICIPAYNAQETLADADGALHPGPLPGH